MRNHSLHCGGLLSEPSRPRVTVQGSAAVELCWTLHAAVKQEFDALARGHAALGALFLDAIGAAGGLRLARELLKSFEIFFKGHLSNPR